MSTVMHCRRTGFTLIELLIVLALMAVLAGLAIPRSSGTVRDQLRSAAQVLAADLAYARSLAVTCGSRYRVSFDFDNGRYTLEYSGDNPNLRVLPPSAFRNPGDPPDKHIVDLGDLPRLGAPVRLEAALTVGSSIAPASEVEFGPLGETSASGHTLIWLSCGEGDAKRYFLLSVNPVTGLATWDDESSYSATGPPDDGRL